MKASTNTMTVRMLLEDDIIYVERIGAQTEQPLAEAFEHAKALTAQLRQAGKAVLLLNYAHDTSVDEYVLQRLQHFDFDRLAVFGTPQKLNKRRDLMARANGLEQKIASFQSREEALRWLHVS